VSVDGMDGKEACIGPKQFLAYGPQIVNLTLPLNTNHGQEAAFSRCFGDQ